MKAIKKSARVFLYRVGTSYGWRVVDNARYLKLESAGTFDCARRAITHAKRCLDVCGYVSVEVVDVDGGK